MEIFARASQFAGTASTVKAKSLLASVGSASRSFSLLIPIMICLIPCLAPEPRSLRACSPSFAMTASDSAVMFKRSNAFAEQPR
jgi:hypothetical protein